MREWRKTARFRCRDDDGREYDVIELAEFISYPSRKGSGSVHSAAARKRYVLNNGDSVEYIDDNTCRIASSGIVIRKLV